MLSTNNVTTAGSIDGWEIEAHLGVVAAHVVAGVGLVSEFFAGFSDIFGGRSQSYGKQLASLYDDAVAQLLQQAHERGGNWLIGLRVDMDQVSGKGTQMFMITGLATAVRAQHLRLAGERFEHVAEEVAQDKVVVALRRLDIIHHTQNPDYLLSDQDWEILIEQRVGEVAPFVLECLAKDYINRPPAFKENLRKRVKIYFSAIAPVHAAAVLYAGLSNERLRADAVNLINTINLGSLSLVLASLAEPNEDIRHASLQTLGSGQRSYSRRDLATIDKLCAAIPGAFEVRSPLVTRQRMLGGTSEEWQCLCGRGNKGAQARCASCTRDRRGFRAGDVDPEKAIEWLGRLRAAVVSLLDEPKQPT